jgi:large subunit ribosomal protein L31
MKPDIHPKLNPVVFIDQGAGAEFVTRSTMSSKQTKDIDGVAHYVIYVDSSSASHPFFTGKQRSLQQAGRIDRFNKKYNINQGA